MLSNPHQNRKFVIAAVFIGVILLFIAQFFRLQVLDDEFETAARNNALLRRTLHAPRGMIFDRNGTLLVYNKPAYDITVVMRRLQVDTLELCRVLGIDREFFEMRMDEIRRRRGFSWRTPQVFMSQLTAQDVAAFKELRYRFPGFDIQNRELREYAFPNAAHILGNIGEVSPRQLEADNFYRRGDFAGQAGIEYTYERLLRGERGVEVLLRDAHGRIQGRYRNGAEDRPPVAGEDITITIDIALQKLGERLLNGMIGSIVAIKPQTGEILAMVSNPTFDPSLLVGRERGRNFRELAEDPTRPLFNRAVQAQYSPGSTFKMIQAAVALEMGGIRAGTTFICHGRESRPIRCTHSHQTPTDVYVAIQQSCNPFFWGTFRNTLELEGYGVGNANFIRTFNTWASKVRSFGLGDRFENTDIFQQSAGFIPTEEFFDRRFGPRGWRAMTIRSLAIGQGEILTTPLQMANFTAVLANRGWFITPHLRKTEQSVLQRNYAEISPEHFIPVVEGMRRMMTHTGGGIRNQVPGVPIAGKTGTTQNPHGENHSMWVGFAPLNDPQIAIAVVVENSGFGATFALPIATLMIEQYILGEVRRTELLNRMENWITNPDVVRR